MFTGQNIICISSIDWDFVWQGHQEIMSAFAEAGNRVLYIENTGVRTPTLKDIPRLRKRLINWRKGVSGIRRERENLFVYSPLVLPFPYSRIIKPLNRMLFVYNVKKWMSMADFANPIIWTFLPTNLTIDLIDNIDNKKLIVYYCIAEFAQLVKSSKKIERIEKELLKRCDIIFAQGKKIKEQCLKYNKNVHIFPFGVNDEVFLKSATKNMDVADTSDILERGIKLGYIGGIHKHVDVDLLKDIASRRPDWSIELIGPMQIQKDTFKDYKNIYPRGKKNHNELPLYISKFDVCLIPYILNEYTMTVYPTKLNEYLIMGKPVVSTAIPEVVRFNKEHNGIIEIADDTDAFYRKIEKALESPSDEETKKRRKAVAMESSWSSRIEKMTYLMGEAMNIRHSEKAQRWREEMILFYKRLKIKILKIGLTVVLLHVIAFKTPILWFMASPLKMSQLPEKADAIVVFAGGVGESGRPGQGYEERVERAIELYKNGYSNHIIFSTGFRYSIQEADIMKALAVSLGIPHNAIILEKKASNTYENAKFSGAIIKNRKWGKVLLISSPYNMRRAMLVFKSLYPDVEVIPTPMMRSHYYAHTTGANIKQYRGIIHEYVGILYYWLKGYI